MAKLWKEISWKPEHLQKVYRDWGIHYSFNRQYYNAFSAYNKSLELKNDDIGVLYRKSLCLSDVAQTEQALEDALAALAIDKKKHVVNVRVCDATYDCNHFEQAQIELCNKSHMYKGSKAKPFLDRLEILHQNFMDCLGDNCGKFLQANSKILAKILLDEMEKRKDPIPMWKVLKSQNKCDVVSMVMEVEKNYSPLQQARIDQYFRIFTQVYLLKGWKDVVFLKELSNNKTLLLQQTQQSTKFLEGLIKNRYEIVYKFLKMLHARDPLYDKRAKIYPSAEHAARMREVHLYRVQYETRRHIYQILHKVLYLRARGKLEKMCKFIENSMAKYIETKTRRILPWKFEFLNEIYNIVGLTHLDKLQVPSDLFSTPMDDRIFILLDLPRDKDKSQPVKFIFGDKSTYQEPDAVDHKFIAYKKRISILERRLKESKLSIEKCYLLIEMARNHFIQSKIDEARSLGKKVIAESQICENSVYKFLGALILCKADTAQKKIERNKSNIIQAAKVSAALKNPRITHFMEIYKRLNLACIDIKRTVSDDALKTKQKSKKRGSLEFDYV